MNQKRDAEEPMLADPAVVNSFRQKLIYQLKKREWKNTDLARKTNVSGTAVGKWVRTGIIGKANLMAVCQVFDKPVTYFMNPDIPVEDGGISLSGHATGAAREIETVQIRDYGLAHNKTSSPGSTLGPILSMMVRKSWLEENLGVEPLQSNLFIYTVQADTMAPTLNRGDVLLIDTSNPQTYGNGMHLVNIRGREGVRRLQVLPDGAIVVSCDNDLYENFTTHEHGVSADNVQILGRVVIPISLRPL